MKKQKAKAVARTKRRNQNKRIREHNANNKPVKSFLRRFAEGPLQRKDKVEPTSKHIWPNQAIPGRTY